MLKPRLLQLWLDLLVAVGVDAVPAIATVLFEMVESPSSHVHLHAFELLFNLSVHVMMLAEVDFLTPNGSISKFKEIQEIHEALFRYGRLSLYSPSYALY